MHVTTLPGQECCMQTLGISDLSRTHKGEQLHQSAGKLSSDNWTQKVCTRYKNRAISKARDLILGLFKYMCPFLETST